MKLQFLGTAAYEGIPALFCECETCRKARELGGKNMRTRSQAIIDDRILIDFNADTYAHFLKYNVPMAKLKTCIVTHSHSDHFYQEDMIARFNGPYAHVNNDEPLKIYGGKDVYEKTAAAIERNRVPEKDLQAVLIKPFETFEAEGYKITALNAAHDPNSVPYIYLIEKDGKVVFYSMDTWFYPDDTMEFLSKYDKKIDLVVFDCTFGDKPNEWKGHMNVEQCGVMRDKLCEMGLCGDNTKYILNHFSHNGGSVLYDEMIHIARENNYDLSYDGMIVEF